MHTFQTALECINDTIYEPNHLVLTSIKEERQNSEYAAGRFTVSKGTKNSTIRFRVAKQTPNKVGQFVTFWEKDDNRVNRAFSYNDETPDLLVITVFKSLNQFGQFVFPKDVLFKKGILATNAIKGKMGMRVYPSWDKPSNKTALSTQRWQLDYFFGIKGENTLASEKILELYKL